MANTKISELPSTTTITDEDAMPVVQEGVTKKFTGVLTALKTLLGIGDPETLQTQSKEVVGAVNELNGKTEEVATDIGELKESSTVLEAQVYLENFKSTDGSSFQKNFLNFGQLDFDKEAYFAKGDSESGWTNTPSIIGNTVWIGARRVYNHNNQHVLIEITEFYPSHGRIWTNFYNVSYWSGWKSVTPQ